MKIELLSPAGNFEKMKAAVDFGADAVYFGGEAFGLRAHAGNFTIEQMAEAMKYLHENGKKGYLTVNAYARDEEIDALEEYLQKAADAGVDAFIISDPGVFQVAKDTAPHVERHISTQANTTNSSAVKFWKSLGASRVILARELSEKELINITTNPACEVEIFVHGAICISYSGRCTMSAYMTGRDANRGECTQPCRWNYVVKEVTRPDQEMQIEEDERGTYLYNAKDLRLVAHVNKLVQMGISSLKIEGRMKSLMYVAVVTAVYRKAIDMAVNEPQNVTPELIEEWKEILNSVSNRHYTEGFFSAVPDKESMNYDTSAYVRTTDFLGNITTSGDNFITIECRGKFSVGEELEIFMPGVKMVKFKIDQILNMRGESMPNTRSSEQFKIVGNLDVNVPQNSILRRIILSRKINV